MLRILDARTGEPVPAAPARRGLTRIEAHASGPDLTALRVLLTADLLVRALELGGTPVWATLAAPHRPTELRTAATALAIRPFEDARDLASGLGEAQTIHVTTDPPDASGGGPVVWVAPVAWTGEPSVGPGADPAADPAREPGPGHGPGHGPEPGSGRAPEPGPARAPEPGPARAPEPGPARAPETPPGHVRESAPRHAPEPGPGRAPEPAPGRPLESAPGHVRESGPRYASEPGPGRAPEPAPGHVPESAPGHGAEPGPSRAPESAPEPGPSRAPEPDPSRAPEPGPRRAPESAPGHGPEPGPSRAPESAPEPAPHPPLPALLAALPDPSALRLALLSVPRGEPVRLDSAVLEEAAGRLVRWRRAVAGWARQPSRPVPDEMRARLRSAWEDDLDLPGVLEVLRAVESAPDLPDGARFETYVYADRLLALDLARDLGSLS